MPVLSSAIFYAAGSPLHITHFPLECLFNFLDLPSSLYKDVPINFKLIGRLHFEYADCVLLTYCAHYKRPIIFAGVCQDPLIFQRFPPLRFKTQLLSQENQGSINYNY